MENIDKKKTNCLYSCITKRGTLALANLIYTLSMLFFVIYDIVSLILSRISGECQFIILDIILVIFVLALIYLNIRHVFLVNKEHEEKKQLKIKKRLQYYKIFIFLLFTIYIIIIIFIRPISLYQFGKMIETVTNETWGKFNGHGNHCGFGGEPEVAYVDMIDGCCKTHDRCWENVGKNLSHI